MSLRNLARSIGGPQPHLVGRSPALTFDFKKRRFFHRGREGPIARNLDTTRASSKWAEKSDGSLIEIGPNVPALTDKGLLVEPSATNYFGYNDFEDVSLQSTSRTLGSVVDIDGSAGSLTAEIVGKGQYKGLPYFDVRLHGTNDTGETYYWDLVDTVDLACSSGDEFACSAYVQLLAGSYSNVVTRLYCHFKDSGDVTSSQGTFTFTADGTWQRFCDTFTADASAVKIRAKGIYLAVSADDTIDITLRFSGVQFESGLAATSPIITTGSPATRSHDRIVTDISDIDLSQGLYGRWKGELKGGESDYERILSISDGVSNNDSLNLLYYSHSNKLQLETRVGGVGFSQEISDWTLGAQEIVFGFGSSFMQGIKDGVAGGAKTDSGIYPAELLTKLNIGTAAFGADGDTTNALHQELTLYAGTPTTEKLQALVTV